MNEAADRSRDALRRPGPSTMADVAAHARVSTASVSRVLNSPDKVGPALRARVEDAIRELGYVRHGVARALAARRFHTIGAIVPTLGVATFAAGIDALQRRLEIQDYSLLIASTQYDAEAEARQVRLLMERGIDGLVLVGQQRRPEIYRQLVEAGLPYICTYTVGPCAGLSIGYDNAACTRHVIVYLTGLGHRRFGVLTSPYHDNDRIAARLAGAVTGIRAAGIEPPVVVEAPYAIADGRAGLRTIMARRPGITAVVCTTDLHAIGAIAEARALGLSVPERLSITGFDNLEIVAEIDPPLTTVHVPSREIGERAADMLLARVEGRPTAANVELKAELVVRGSTGSAPATANERAGEQAS